MPRRPYPEHFGRSLEKPCDPVGFGEDGSVAESVGEAEHEPHCSTGGSVWRNQDEEGHGEAQQDTKKQDKGELLGSCFDHRSVLVHPKDDTHKNCDQDTWKNEVILRHCVLLQVFSATGHIFLKYLIGKKTIIIVLTRYH